MFRLKVDMKAFRRRNEERRKQTQQMMRRLLNRVGERVVEHLSSYTGEVTRFEPLTDEEKREIRKSVERRYAPGLASSDPETRAYARQQVRRQTSARIRSRESSRRRLAGRPKHPGGWADRSKDLVHSYDYAVRQRGDRWILEIRNESDHAHLVELLDGYFVVSGVADPGGPVHQALRKAVREVAPDWKVTS